MTSRHSPLKNEITVAAAVIVGNEGCFLLARKKHGLSNGGLWEFPGGKVETGETPAQALKRELAEEMDLQNLKVSDPFLHYSWENQSIIIHFHFFTVQVSGFIPRSKDHNEFTWLNADEIDGLELEITEADRPALAFLSEHPEYLLTQD